MRDAFELRRILSLANIVLLAILAYIIVSSIHAILAEDIGQKHAMNLNSEAVEANTNINENPLPLRDHKIILERNIFGSNIINSAQEKSQKEKIEAQSPVPDARKQLELRLLGTVAGDEEIACAIVEDARTKVQDLYRTGDLIQGVRIAKIERNRIILLNEGVREILDLHVARQDSIASEKSLKPEATVETSVADAVKVISPTEHEINKSAFLAKIGGIEAILKTVKLSPYIVNGESKGLRITGLEGLSMAKYVGLQNGDVIQAINGQNITDERKAFQVLRKARALSAADIQLARGKEETILSFRIE